MRSSRILILLAIPCTLAACGLAKPVASPSVDVRGVAVGSASLAGVRGRLDADVSNPNGFGVPLSAVDWQLSIGGARAVTGRLDLSQTIPARGTAPVSVDIAVGARDAVAVARVLMAGERRYRVEGTMHFATRFGSVAVGFAGEGRLGDLLSRRPGGSIRANGA